MELPAVFRSAARCMRMLVTAEGGQVSEANNGEAEADSVCQTAGVCPLSAAVLGERLQPAAIASASQQSFQNQQPLRLLREYAKALGILV